MSEQPNQRSGAASRLVWILPLVPLLYFLSIAPVVKITQRWNSPTKRAARAKLYYPAFWLHNHCPPFGAAFDAYLKMLSSTRTSSKSPDGKWELICKAPTNNEADARHVLLLKRMRGGVVELRRIEGNGCHALWSPDSSHLAVTDRWASDRSDVWICSLAHPQSGRSLAKLLPTGAIRNDELSGHCYFESVKWLSSRLLQVRISGHTDEAPVRSFEHDFVFDVQSGGFKQLEN
jgi:hypothetical protein